MRAVTKFLLASGLIAGLAGETWAQSEDRAARGEGTQRQEAQKSGKQKAALKDGEVDLRREIASPVTGAFSAGAQWTNAQPHVGGYSGNGFLSPTGQPSSVPGDPGTYR